MKIEDLSPQQLNKISAMLLYKVNYDQDFNPIHPPGNWRFVECAYDDSISIEEGEWNPIEGDSDLFLLLRDGSISIVKDRETGLWDIGEMDFWGYGEYQFVDSVKIWIEDRNLSKEVVKAYIKGKVGSNKV